MKFFSHIFYACMCLFFMYKNGWNTLEALISFAVVTVVAIVMTLMDILVELRSFKNKGETK